MKFQLPILLMRMAGALVAADLAFDTASSATLDSERCVFPQDPSLLDVKRDFGAKGDGVADDTAALQAGIAASSDRGKDGGTKILYLPNGTYRVTSTLVVNARVGPWVYGESRDGVVIRLADGVPTNVTAVLRTHPSDTQASSADFFMRNFRHLTIDVGRNPDADGIRWYGNNSGILKNVRVIGTGRVGINSGWLGQNGPNLIQDALVEGSFETGVRCAWSWGQTLSRVTVRNARQEGVYVNATAVGIEDLVVEETPVALHNEYPNDWKWWGGVVALSGGRFTGGDPSRPAITNTSVLYARNVTSRGFKQVLQSTSPGGNVAGTNLDEYLSHPAKRLFPDAPETALKLPIRPEPLVPWETNLSNWVCANDHGAKFGDNQDDTAAVQAAVDAAAAVGKTVVYLRGIGGGDPNWYDLNGEVRVHGSVRFIIGLGFGRVLGGEKGRFIVDDRSAPVVKFLHLQAFGGRPPVVENRSAINTLVVESCDLKILGTGGGDIFVTDCPSGIELRSPGQRLWARQLNPEGDSDTGLVQNHGGQLWALGVKHEGRGGRFLTDQGGQTEILGLFNYAPDIAKDDLRPAFDMVDADFSAAGAREISFGNTYPVKARERRGEEVRLEKGGGWIGWALFRGGTNHPASADQQAAKVKTAFPDEVGRDLRTADYLKPGRDYHVGVAKPGYQKFTYPHPHRIAGTGRDAVAGDPVRFELRTVDAAGPANPWIKIAGDLDGDGREDLIVGGQNGPLVWYGWPDFRKHSIADSGWSTVSGAVGDVDGDGDLDVLMGGSVWFEAPADPRASPWREHRLADPIEAVVHSLAAADFDRDGRMDIAFAEMHQGADPDEVGVFLVTAGGRPFFWLADTAWWIRQLPSALPQKA